MNSKSNIGTKCLCIVFSPQCIGENSLHLMNKNSLEMVFKDSFLYDLEYLLLLRHSVC